MCYSTTWRYCEKNTMGRCITRKAFRDHNTLQKQICTLLLPFSGNTLLAICKFPLGFGDELKIFENRGPPWYYHLIFSSLHGFSNRFKSGLCSKGYYFQWKEKKILNPVPWEPQMKNVVRKKTKPLCLWIKILRQVS